MYFAGLARSTTPMISANSSANDATNYGSGLDVAALVNLSLQFCTFSFNTQANCLAIDYKIANSRVWCLALIGNACKSGAARPGLVWADSKVILQSCVFESNLMDCFIVGSGSVIFLGCVFDRKSLDVTGSVSVSTPQCSFVMEAMLLSKCAAAHNLRRQDDDQDDAPSGSPVSAPAQTVSHHPLPSPSSTAMEGPGRTPTDSPVSSATPITVNGYSFRTVSLDAGGQVVMIIASWPVFVIFPVMHDLCATVYDSSGGETDSFQTPTTAFAVYFYESGGRVVFTATQETILQFFTYKLQDRWTNVCRNYYLSSAPHEMWKANQTGGNFTLGNSQDICLFHVSDNVTTVEASFDTQSNRDYLDVEYSGSADTSLSYSGIDNISESSTHFTAIRWSSDASNLSTLISIELSSPFSSFPYCECNGSVGSEDPTVLHWALPAATRTATPPPTRTRSPSPTQSQSPTASESHSPSATSTRTPSPTISGSPTATKSRSATPTGLLTPSPTAS
jgi:hypothetical protein